MCNLDFSIILNQLCYYQNNSKVNNHGLLSFKNSYSFHSKGVILCRITKKISKLQGIEFNRRTLQIVLKLNQELNAKSNQFVRKTIFWQAATLCLKTFLLTAELTTLTFSNILQEIRAQGITRNHNQLTGQHQQPPSWLTTSASQYC